MRKNELLKFILLVISIFYIGKNNVTAFTVSQYGETHDWADKGKMGIKYYTSASTIVYCTAYDKTTPAGTGVEFSEIVWNSDTTKNNKIAAGVAAIINKAGIYSKEDARHYDSENGYYSYPSQTYYYAEFAINEFLSDYNGCVDCEVKSGTPDEVKSYFNSYSTLYATYYDAAVTAYNNYSSGGISLSTSSLTFTRSGDYYISNTITVTKNQPSGTVYYTPTTSAGEIVTSGDTFYVKVPASSITSTQQINVTVTPSKTVAVAQNYKGSDNYQTVTSTITRTQTVSLISASATGTITPFGNLTINKVDSNNQPVKGAKIKITGPNNYSLEYVTDGTSKVLNNLPLGKYTIEEISAPEGYTLSDKKEVTLSSTNLNGTVTLTDNIIKTVFSKLDVTGKIELPGATL